MTPTEATAAVLKFTRERVGLTQKELAEKMRTRRSHISQLENGKIRPDIETMDRWGVAVGVTASQILRERDRLMRGEAFIPVNPSQVSSCVA